ncbi:hypothetical protein MBH78_20115 [Oceanimonas sp. NS1]|nr:hypothetical protein [Oceanimonas sp. NS1]
MHPWEKAADVELNFSSGPRYRFGELRVDSDRPVDRLLNPLVDIKPGDPYQAGKLAELSRSLSSTRYFKQVEVLPQVAEADDQQRVPLSVVLRARADNEVELGVGVSTDEGPRVSVNWDKPWINSLGHSLTTSLKVSAPSQDVTLVYKIPAAIHWKSITPYRAVISGWIRTTPRVIVWWPVCIAGRCRTTAGRGMYSCAANTNPIPRASRKTTASC